jgi:hypothetical protein
MRHKITVIPKVILERKLIIILCADVYGYSWLMSQDGESPAARGLA